MSILKGITLGNLKVQGAYLGTTKIYSSIFKSTTLFKNNEKGLIVDFSNKASMFKDAAGTQPVTMSGDPVGLVLDLSGNGYHLKQTIAAFRPIYGTNGTEHYLTFDGTDDFLICDTGTFTNSSNATYIVKYKTPNSAGGPGSVNTPVFSFGIDDFYGETRTSFMYGINTLSPKYTGINVSRYSRNFVVPIIGSDMYSRPINTWTTEFIGTYSTGGVSIRSNNIDINMNIFNETTSATLFTPNIFEDSLAYDPEQNPGNKKMFTLGKGGFSSVFSGSITGFIMINRKLTLAERDNIKL